MSERTRIAREPHDTLLQSFHGLVLRFQSASNLLPARPGDAKQRLDVALDQAEAAIAEGRDAVQGLRSSAVMVNDLANGIAAIGAELTTDRSDVDASAIDVKVEGASRDLNPVVRDEAYRIAGEAVRNAFTHARARRITVTIYYEARQFRLIVRDDGKGMNEQTLQRQQAAGHFGLPGMRERAAVVRDGSMSAARLAPERRSNCASPRPLPAARPRTRPGGRDWWVGRTPTPRIRSSPP